VELNSGFIDSIFIPADVMKACPLRDADQAFGTEAQLFGPRPAGETLATERKPSPCQSGETPAFQLQSDTDHTKWPCDVCFGLTEEG